MAGRQMLAGCFADSADRAADQAFNHETPGNRRLFNVLRPLDVSAVTV